MPSATAPEIRFNHVRLREWRDEARMRLEDVAHLAGVSYPYLRSLEDQGGNPAALILARIAAVYGRPLGELFGPADGGDQ